MALAFLVPFAWVYGTNAAFGALVHAMLEEYVPFIVLLATLYTVAGGICLKGDLRVLPVSTPGCLRSARRSPGIMGTTGRGHCC